MFRQFKCCLPNCNYFDEAVSAEDVAGDVVEPGWYRGVVVEDDVKAGGLRFQY